MYFALLEILAHKSTTKTYLYICTLLKSHPKTKHQINRFNVNKLFSDELERVLPEDAHERLSGRLTVSLTHGRSMKNVLVDEFDSRADLIDAVVCSCFIPGFSAYEVPTYKVSSDCTGRSMIWQDCCSTRTGRY